MPETATVQITMPEMGESVTEGIVLEWHVAEGDAVKEGDTVKVKVLAVDDRGKVKLSMKAVNQQTGEETAKEGVAAE